MNEGMLKTGKELMKVPVEFEVVIETKNIRLNGDTNINKITGSIISFDNGSVYVGGDYAGSIRANNNNITNDIITPLKWSIDSITASDTKLVSQAILKMEDAIKLKYAVA